MKLIVYFHEEKQVISCDKDEFVADEPLDFDHLDGIDDGEIVSGTCMYDDKPFAGILLQVSTGTDIDMGRE